MNPSSLTRSSRPLARLLALTALSLGLGLATAPAAGAAQATNPAFAVGLGSVLPSRGDVAQVSVTCPVLGQGTCAGSVSLIGRGKTAASLGTDALASETFKLNAGGDADLKLRLGRDAADALSEGPLLVTAVLRSGGGSKPVAERPAAIAHATFYSPPPQAKMASATATASGETTYSWDFNIPAGKAVAMKAFSCPASAPVVARGSHERTRAARVVDIYERDGKLEASAADGTGYAGFDRPSVKQIESGLQRNYSNMTGWPQGGFFYNSIWAPLSKTGQFSLKVTCTDVDGLSAARLFGWYDDGAAHLKNFFPWKW